MPNKREYEFVLVLDGISELTSEVEDALFEAGCDDATVSVGSGRVYLTFARTAPTFNDAISSAIKDVKKANISADVLRVVIHNAEEGGYWAEVPSLPGCVSEGETVEEVLGNIREALEGLLLSYRSAGEPIPWENGESFE